MRSCGNFKNNIRKIGQRKWVNTWELWEQNKWKFGKAYEKNVKNTPRTNWEHIVNTTLNIIEKIWDNKTPKNLQVLAFPTPTPPTNQRSYVIHEVLRTMNVFAIVSSIPRTQTQQEENHDNPSKQLVKLMHIQNSSVHITHIAWIYAFDVVE